MCILDGQTIAVFLSCPATPEAHNEIAAPRPDWLSASVFASVTSCDRALAIIDAESGPRADADLARCAFTTACIAVDAGAFSELPSRYRIRFTTLATALDVTMDIDDWWESWHGEVSRPPSANSRSR